jgi:hypothetical protein
MMTTETLEQLDGNDTSGLPYVTLSQICDMYAKFQDHLDRLSIYGAAVSRIVPPLDQVTPDSM